jgi:stage III sporulation protein AG
MRQFFKNFLEKNGRKRVQNLLLMLLAGILLLVVSAYFASVQRGEGGDDLGVLAIEFDDFAPQSEQARSTSHGTESLAGYLARQLEEILSLVAGAGDVRVMLTMGSSQMVYAQNSQENISTTIEHDGEGGIRNIDTQTGSLTYVMVRMADGAERPLRLQETRPDIQGVIIVAQGGGDIAVRDALIRAAHTVLGIGAHQVQVFQMNNE